MADIGSPIDSTVEAAASIDATSSLSGSMETGPTSSRVATADETAKYGPLFQYTIDDVRLSEQEDQPIMKGKSESYTSLIGIGPEKTAGLSAKHLRNWATREGMGLRTGKKSDQCVAIVRFVKEHRRLKAAGLDTQRPETIYGQSKINYVRLINTMRDDTVKTALRLRGTQLNRSQLDDGVQGDEDLFVLVAEKYNQGHDIELAITHYPVDWDVQPDPSSFTPIDWKKAQKAFKDMSSAYDLADKNWHASGFHDDFEVQPFSDYASSKWLIYLHEFLLLEPKNRQI